MKWLLLLVGSTFLLQTKPGALTQDIKSSFDSMYYIAWAGGRIPERLVKQFTSVDSAIANNPNTYHWYAGRDANTIYDSIRLMVIEASNITCYEKYLVTFNPQGKQMGILNVAYWCDRSSYISEYNYTDYKWLGSNTIAVNDMEIIGRRGDGNRWYNKVKYTRTYRIAPDGTIDVMD